MKGLSFLTLRCPSALSEIIREGGFVGALRRIFSLEAPGDRECQDQVAEFLLEVRIKFFLYLVYNHLKRHQL